MTATVVVRLADSARYMHHDHEDGRTRPITLPAGTAVLTTGRYDRGQAYVRGVARPTIHGGGVHTTVTDPDTGTAFPAIVHAYKDT